MAQGGYLVTESDGTTHLPTEEPPGTLSRALCGAAWASLHGGYRGNKYDGPNKDKAISKLTAIYKAHGWDVPDATMSASFAVDEQLRADGAMVIRRGKIFEAGDWPDKSFSITPDELAAAAAAFTPCTIDLEHQSTVLDNQLGQLQSVDVGEDGATLFGTVALPAWLDGLLEGSGRKVSATWNRATKLLEGLALVNTPRITDAALMSAFSAASMDRASFMALAEAHFAGSRHNKADQADIQKIHDLAASQGAACSPASMHREDKRMTNKLAEWFGLGPKARSTAREAGADIPDEVTFTLIEDAAKTARDQEQNAAVADLQRQLQEKDAALFKATADRLQGEAAAFVDGLIVGGKVWPAERESVIALYAQAGMDDAANGPVTFANGTKGSRLDQIKASYEARPAHGLTQEQLATMAKDGAAFALLNGGKDKDKGPDGYSDEKLLSMTAAGRETLKRKKAQA